MLAFPSAPQEGPFSLLLLVASYLLLASVLISPEGASFRENIYFLGDACFPHLDSRAFPPIVAAAKLREASGVSFYQKKQPYNIT